jgi:hypothetical protein
MRRTALLVAVVLAVLAPVAAAQTAQDAKPAGVTWGSVHFTDSGKLSAWLGSRGVRYVDWARRHPSGRYLLTHPAAPARALVTTRPGARFLIGPADATNRSKGSVVALLFVAALLLALSAAGGALVRVAQPQVDPARLTTARFGAACGGVAVAIGTALAWWL